MNSTQPSNAIIQNLCALRSLSIAGATVLVYDTFLLLPEEIRYVWPYILPWRREQLASGDGRFFIPRIFIILIRYITLANVTVYIITLIPPQAMSDRWCRVATTVVANVDVFIEVTASAIIVQCLSKLCSFARRASLFLIGGFVIIKTISLAFGLISVGMEAPTSTSFDSTLQTCIITKLSRFTLAAWITAATFDAFCLSLLVVNVLSRPRLGSQPILNVLHAHGVLYFLTTFCMRIMNVIFVSLASSHEAPLFFMGAAFSGVMVTVAATRSFLRFFRPRDAPPPLAERRVVWQDAGAPAALRHEVCVCCLRPDASRNQSEALASAGGVPPDYGWVLPDAVFLRSEIEEIQMSDRKDGYYGEGGYVN